MTFPLRSQKGPERMRAIVARTTKLTPLKAVATKAIQMAQDERTQAMDLATVISADQALTAADWGVLDAAFAADRDPLGCRVVEREGASIRHLVVDLEEVDLT